MKTRHVDSLPYEVTNWAHVLQGHQFVDNAITGCSFLPAENVAFQPLLLCNASVTNLINISPLEAVIVIRGDVPNVKPLFGCRRSPLVVAPS